jgi:photosystem II stability/assembly factor-like uncharacterized protein
MRHTTPRAILLLIGGFLLAATARSQPPSWKPLGPFGGNIKTLTADSGHPGVLYATTLSDVFQTVDGGLSWRSIYHDLDWDGNVAVDPVHPGTLYLSGIFSAKQGGALILKTTDGGAHWRPASRGLPQYDSSISAAPRVGVDPVHPRNLYMIYHDAYRDSRRIWRSHDAGESWQPARSFRQDGEIRGFAMAAHQTGIAFVSSTEGIYKTVDAGTSWKRMDHGLFPWGPDALALAPSDPRIAYAVFDDIGVYRTSDGGESWQRAGEAPVASPVQEIVVSLSPRTLYARFEGGLLFRSRDGGIRWDWIAAPPGLPVKALAVDPFKRRTVYAGVSNGAPFDPETLGGVFGSDDEGTSWKLGIRGMTGFTASLLAVDPGDPQRLWAFAGPLLFRSANGGAGWARRPRPPEAGHPLALAITPASRVFVDTFDFYSGTPSVWSTGDDGAVWSRLSGLGNSGQFEIALSDPSTFYAVDSGRGELPPSLLRSTDGGESWEVRSTGVLTHCDGLRLSVSPASSAILHFHGVRGLYDGSCGAFRAEVFRSQDGGATWSDISAGVPGEILFALSEDPRDPNVVYVGTGEIFSLSGEGVWKTTDGGATWKRAGEELAGQSINALLASSIPDRVYAVTGEDRVFRSNDGGASWVPWDQGLLASEISALVADPTDPRRVYAVTSNGIWRLAEAA